jgi:ammonia channel protein AmtB
VTKRPALIVPAVIVGVALLALAVVYVVATADALPSFVPGHEDGSTHHHVKHGIAAALLGIACLIFAWFQTGPSSGERVKGARSR